MWDGLDGDDPSRSYPIHQSLSEGDHSGDWGVAVPIDSTGQAGFGPPAQDPYAFRPPQPQPAYASKPVVMDADLSLFSAAPVNKSIAQTRSPAPPQQGTEHSHQQHGELVS